MKSILRAKVNLSEGAFKRAKELLRGAADKVHEHRLTIGIHEAEGHTQAADYNSGQIKVTGDVAKRNYAGKTAPIALIEAALFAEFGTRSTPERSWLRGWYDGNLERLKSEATAAMRAEYEGEKNAVHELAKKWGDELRAGIVTGSAAFAPLSARTKAERRAAGLSEGPPLFATGQLVEAIRAMADADYV